MNEANGKSVDRPCGRIKMVPIYASDDVIESPRELRRLHYLREWSHDEQIKQIFP